MVSCFHLYHLFTNYHKQRMGNCFSCFFLTLSSRNRGRVERGGAELSSNITNPFFNIAEFNHNGVNSTALLINFAEGNEAVTGSYILEKGISSGPHWAACKGKRIVDSKEVIIKRISKEKLPPTEAYLPPCISNNTCKCPRCSPSARRPPLELILLQSKDNSLPEFVCCLDDSKNWFLITKTHGISERKYTKIWTWFGSRRFSRVAWHEYLS